MSTSLRTFSRRRQVALKAIRSGRCSRRLNGVLPADVRVRRVTRAPDGFDARFSALWRRYAYRIADSPELIDPLTRHQVLAWPRPLDLGAMNAAAAGLVGEHDFAAFCKKREGATTVRTLLDLSWQRAGDGVAEATVRADAFCHNMVRSLVGCLVFGGRGAAAARSGRQRCLRGGSGTRRYVVLPAHGLTLEEVAYPDDADLASRADEARNTRGARRWLSTTSAPTRQCPSNVSRSRHGSGGATSTSSRGRASSRRGGSTSGTVGPVPRDRPSGRGHHPRSRLRLRRHRSRDRGASRPGPRSGASTSTSGR